VYLRLVLGSSLVQLPSAEAVSDAGDRVELIVVNTDLADNVVCVAIADASAEGERAYDTARTSAPHLCESRSCRLVASTAR
jgi:hypothetical protein